MEDSPCSSCSSNASSRTSYQSLSTKHANPIIIITPPGEPFPCLSNVDQAKWWFINADADEELPALRTISKKPLASRSKPPMRRAPLEDAQPADMNVIIKRAMLSGALTRSVWSKVSASRPPPTASLPEDIETPLSCTSCPDLLEALTPPGLDTSQITKERSSGPRRFSMITPGTTVCDGRDERLHSWSFDEDEVRLS